MAEDWRHKYLELLREQEVEAGAQAARLTQLRRALVRISVAAGGLDESLDAALARLHESLKASDWEALGPALEKTESAVRDFEARRADQQRHQRQALETLCRQLLDLRPPKAVKQSLKQLMKSLKTRVAAPAELPTLLDELATLQADSLAQQETGGWRLPWRERKASNAAPDPAPVAPVPAGSALQTSAAPAPATHTAAPPVALGPVEDLLRQLLADMELVSDSVAASEQLYAARQRIAEGMSWQALLPTLEDVRDLVMHNQLAATQAFADYLVEVNQELQTIHQLATSAGRASQAQVAARASITARVDQELSDLSQDVANASELDSLKTAVNRRIEEIRQAVAHEQANSETGEADIQALVSQVAQLEQQAQRAQASLQEQWQRARQDSLTGLPNREAYNERSEQEFLRWRRYRHPLTLVVLDIDHFKQVNDTYGHQAGDRVLKLVSRELAKRLREVDFIARIGGEEFVILLPDTPLEGGLKAMDTLREDIAQVPFHHKQSPVPITLSAGISEFREGDSLEGVFERADRALYQAKVGGRNRCCVDH